MDFRNDAGKTTLLVLVSEANKGSGGRKGSTKVASSLLKEVKELVETRGADPKVRDHEGKGALHYLCSYDTKPTEEPSEDGGKRPFGLPSDEPKVTVGKIERKSS